MAAIKQRVLNLMRYRPLWRLALAISVLVILYLATTPNPYPVPASASDKLNHLIAFLELTLLTRLAWPEARALQYVPALLGFGVAIELLQATLPHRDFSIADMVADGAGILLGLLPWPGLNRLTNPDLRKSPDSV